MRVSMISSYKYSHAQNSSVEREKRSVLNFGVQTNTIGHALGADQILFGAKPPVEFFLADFNDLPCPCCGVKMLSNKEWEKLNNDVLGHSSEKAVEALSKYEEYMHPVEKACFNEIKELSKKNPQKRLDEILASVREYHLKRLMVKELDVLNVVEEASATLPEKQFKAFKSLTDQAEENIIKQDSGDSFKRKDFLSKAHGLIEEFPKSEKATGEHLFEIIKTLPSSDKDADAFMVKYSGKNEKGQKRSSKEIGQSLLTPSLGTFEHVKPKYVGGDYGDSNGLLECKECNNNRGHLSFEEFAKLHPLMITNPNNPEGKGNLQMHMDLIIEKIKKGLIKDHNNYPKEISETLKRESDGIIKLDISEMDKIKKNNSKKEVSKEDILSNFKSQFINIKKDKK